MANARSKNRAKKAAAAEPIEPGTYRVGDGKITKVDDPTEYVLLTPSGKAIEGTLETIQGRAEVSSVTKNPDGTLELNWDGGTDVFWDGQETVMRGDPPQRVWLDEDGEEWLESDLKLVPKD